MIIVSTIEPWLLPKDTLKRNTVHLNNRFHTASAGDDEHTAMNYASSFWKLIMQHTETRTNTYMERTKFKFIFMPSLIYFTVCLICILIYELLQRKALHKYRLLLLVRT